MVSVPSQSPSPSVAAARRAAAVSTPMASTISRSNQQRRGLPPPPPASPTPAGKENQPSAASVIGQALTQYAAAKPAQVKQHASPTHPR